MDMICIVCPKSCRIKALPGEPPEISGHSCKRGYQFALDELTDPKRTVCTTVRTAFPDSPVLPVKTSKEIPKGRIFDLMREINSFTLEKRVGRGDVVIENVLSLGTDIIATSDLLKENTYEGGKENERSDRIDL